MTISINASYVPPASELYLQRWLEDIQKLTLNLTQPKSRLALAVLQDWLRTVTIVQQTLERLERRESSPTSTPLPNPRWLLEVRQNLQAWVGEADVLIKGLPAPESRLGLRQLNFLVQFVCQTQLRPYLPQVQTFKQLTAYTPPKESRSYTSGNRKSSAVQIAELVKQVRLLKESRR